MTNLTQFETSPEQSDRLKPANGSNGRQAVAEKPVVAAIESSLAPTPATSPDLLPGGLEDTYVFPASREQTRYWMLAQLDPESTASNMAIAFAIEGELREHVVEQAIAALTMRHEALRTIFRLEAGVLSQVVLARPLYRFTVEDLSSAPAAGQDAALEASVSRHGHTVINLESGPVLRAHLIHMSASRHVMALTMNHIVCDGWSNGLLIRDFTVIYEALLAGHEPILPELPFQFADFSLWQNEYLTSPAADEAAAFWKTHITSDLMALDMPTDHARPSGRSFPGHIESALLPKAIDDQLKAYCRKTGSTKHIVLLAAFEALCARYTGQSEFLLGSTIANRTQPGMEDVVGRFANPQIIVARVDSDPTFLALEQRVRDWETAAYTHQDLPFSRIIEDFQVDQAGATSQFLQVWFLYQKAFMQPQTGSTVHVTPRRSVSGGVDFDLLVSVVERAEGPRIQFEYNTLIFEPARIRGLIDGFIALLGAALDQPSLPLSQLASVEAKPLAIEATAEPAGAPEEQGSFLSAFAGHAAARPSSVALTDAFRSISWQALDRESTAVATELRHAQPDLEILIVHLAPRVESLVALLAGLKLGIRVLPLPAQTGKEMVGACLAQFPRAALLAARDSGCAITLAFEHFAGLAAAASSHASAISVEPEAQENSSLLFLTDATTAAFAEVAAGALFRTVSATLPVIGEDRDGSLLAFSAPNPLDATLDLLVALAGGSQLSLAADVSGQSVAQQVAQHEVSCVLATPTQVKQMVTAGWAGDRRVSLVLRGERLAGSQAHVRALRLKSAVYLLSSPQAAGYAAMQVVSGEQAANDLLPLGQTSLVLKNAAGQDVPVGAFGEVWVRTAASQQAESDVATGSMASSSASGVIELQDRSERYVQLRGHRVCLADIEDAALALPFVQAATVVLPEPDALVLYLAAPTAHRDAAAVERHLAQTLPSHLTPNDILWVETLPYAADGRIDLQRLPKREHALAAPAVNPDALPLNKVEEKLAGIWKDVLGLRSIDIHKSFFVLGGSSLLLVRLFARINKAFDTSLPITTIFDAQTVAALAITLGGEAEMSHLVRVQTGGSKPPLFMIHSYLLYQGLSNSLGAEQPFYGLRELSEDGHLTIDERVRRYVGEIQQAQPHGPYHLAGWCAAGPLTVEVARQLLQAGEEIRYLALFDSWLPGYLESVESLNVDGSWKPYKTFGSKVNYHRNRVRGLAWTKKTQYVWMAVARIAKEARYRIYLHNWERLHRLSQKYRFSLPQFMHNTSLETFSALKEYQGRQLPVRLTLIRATDSREVAGAAPSCGWETVAEHGVDVLWAPGDHETMFIGKNLKVTSEIVQLGLEASSSEAAGPGGHRSTEEANQPAGGLHVDCPST